MQKEMPVQKKMLALLVGALGAALGGGAAESAAPRATGEWLDTGWRFSRYHAVREPRGAERPDFDASGWRTVRLPHDWGVEFPFSEKVEGVLGRLPYFGTGWYKRDFTVTDEQRRGRVFLDFGGAMSLTTVYVNGRKVGERPFGFISFRVDATDALVPGARQHLAVRLENRQGSGRWYHGGGLYRRVRLTFAPKVHVDTWGVTVRSTVRGRDAEVTADVKVAGGAGTVACTVFDGARPVATLADGRGVIRDVHLWDVDDPHLYVLEVRVTAADGETDVYRQPFGVRTVEFRPKEGMFLNGRYLKLRGVCQHSDTGALGTAAYARAFERQLELLKGMGANAVRTSHNPPSVEMLDACDRLGLLVMDEAFDMWTIRKGGPNAYTRYFNDWWKTDLTDFIRRDRNHPSVVMWSIGNEVGEQWKPEIGLPIASNLVATCHAEDPTRPVTIGCDARATWTNGYVQVVDVFGVNYKADLYGDFYRLFPGKGLVGTETESLLSTRDAYYFPEDDDWGSLERPNYRGMYDFQVSSYEKYTIRPSNTAPEIEFKAQRQFPQCYGCFVWTGFDYLGEPSPYERAQPYHRASSPEKRAEMDAFRAQYGTNACPSRSSYYGIFDLCGFPKDRYWSYRAEWRPDVPTAHILPHWTWPGREGRLTPVHVYANGDEATLYVNGKPQGRRVKDEALRFMWNNVRYEPGEVKVIVMKDGKFWAKAVRRTAGPAARLEAAADRTTLKGLQDLAYVSLALRDRQGTVVPEADVELTFTASGAVEVIGLCNGDPTDWTGFQAGRQKTFHGLCQAVVRVREGATGPGSLVATGGGLSAKVDFTVLPDGEGLKE